jgi:glutamate carboxypeptidase
LTARSFVGRKRQPSSLGCRFQLPSLGAPQERWPFCGWDLLFSLLVTQTAISGSTHDQSASLFTFCQEHQAEMLDLIRRWVELESPSDNKAAVDRLGAELKRDFERIGGTVKLFPHHQRGENLRADFPGRSGAKPVLLLGHLDTVWPLGTLARMPFRVDEGRAFGPGILDMKAGIAMMIFALRALVAVRQDHRPVIVMLDTDEEVGSATGRPLIEAAARESDSVLVLEPAQTLAGHLKTSRKGVGDFTIRVRGHASHAGVDFEKGHSAVVELARQVLEVAKLTDVPRGITVNPGVIRGGTRTNVVAAEAEAEVDIRVAHSADAMELEAKFAALRPFDPACSIEVSGGLNRPPMERTPGTVRLFGVARQQAHRLGFDIGESSTGGGSDGNFTSALGIPTLDGLGAVGEGAHAIDESIVLAELPRRTALLASLIASI